MPRPETFARIDDCIDALFAAVGKRIVLGLPLGIGKPNAFVNALYRRVAADPTLELKILTALTPMVPKAGSLLERRLLGPIVERLYAGYEPLDYADAVRRDALPPNIEVAEFYFAPASWLGANYAQRQHVCANYSQVVGALIDRGVNAVVQAVARRGGGHGGDGGDGGHGGHGSDGPRYSLGSNPDLTLDLVRALGDGRRPYLVGVVMPAMPFMPNDAETAAGFWDAIVDAGDPAPLFVVPHRPVGLVDHAIATHVTSLIDDGGTLQIGIGSLGDAVAHLIRLRQRDNDRYRRLCGRLIGPAQQSLRAALPVRLEPFGQGLYAASEMLIEGFLDLIEAGVIRRRVPSIAGLERQVLLHGAFFLGSAAFYRRLHSLDEETRGAIEMTGVRFVNTLDDDWRGKSQDRVGARFVNSAMMVTLDGAVISDALAGKRVVSGVGGQHDFVGMAQHLPGARSIIAVPATRTQGGRTRSNIVFEYAHATVPRQFRDVVVTEYGAAELRGASDRDVMLRLLGIADARFQAGLLARAQAAGKIERGYRLPEAYAANTPAALGRALAGELEALPHFPLGTDFTPAEARLAVALDWLKPQAGSKLALARLLLAAPGAAAGSTPLLERMGLASATGFEERIARRLLLAALASTDDARPL